jgi:predicted phosphoribosyltransferase
METVFHNRYDAGHKLAQRLLWQLPEDTLADAVVLGLPRGGVPVAYQVATQLGCPLDVFVVRKLGAPGQPELALGAIASGDVCVMNDDIVARLQVSDDAIDKVIHQERQELARRERHYRGKRDALELRNQTILLIDDGLATGASMHAALTALQQHHPAQIIAAVPVAPADTCEGLESHADVVVCMETPEPFGGVGRWYRHFSQTSDDEVTRLLAAARG